MTRKLIGVGLRKLLMGLVGWAGLLAFSLSTLVFQNAQAEATQIYRCDKQDSSGNPLPPEYVNSATQPPGCKRIELQTAPLVTIPAPKLPSGASSSRPAGFPKVDASAQRARDDDRRRVLESELKVQEEKLAELRREFNNGEPDRTGNERNYQRYLDRVAQLKEDISRGEGNIASIKRELSSLRESSNSN